MPPKPRAASPRRWVRRLLAVLGVVVVVLLGGSCLALRAASRRLVFPAPVDLSPGEAGAAEPVAYQTEDGETLRGFFVPAKAREGAASGAAAPILVFFHGNGETAGSSIFLASVLAKRGISTFLAEYRGYGSSTGKPSEAGLHRDGLAAVRAAAQRGPDLVLGGWSLGTAVAVELARKGHGRALLLLAPFTSIVDASRALVKHPEVEREARRVLGGFDFVYGGATWALGTPLAWLWIADPFDTRSRIGAVEQPTLILHAVDDPIVPYAGGQELAALAKRGQLVTVPDGGHVVHLHPASLEPIVKFVTRAE